MTTVPTFQGKPLTEDVVKVAMKLAYQMGFEDGKSLGTYFDNASFELDSGDIMDGFIDMMWNKRSKEIFRQ